MSATAATAGVLSVAGSPFFASFSAAGFSLGSRISVDWLPPRPRPRPLPLPRPREPRSPFAGPRGAYCDCASAPAGFAGFAGSDAGSGCAVSTGVGSTTGSATGVKSSSKNRSSVPAVCANGSIDVSA